MLRSHARAGTPRERAAAGDSITATAGAAALVLKLQRTAGNAAVNRLLRRRTAGPARGSPDTVTLSVTPERAMTGPEFAVFVAAHLLGVGEDEARVRHDDLGADPHFSAGVTKAEAGVPLAVKVRLPATTVSEAADAAARATQLAALDEGERRAIDAEADRRYRSKLGLPTGSAVGKGAEAELWKRTRDEVVRDRNRMDALAPEVRAVVMPGGKRPNASGYADALSLGAKLGSFSWEDWALFQRRAAGARASGLAATENAVNMFLRRRAEERAVIERLRGTEALYDLVLRFRVAQGMGMKPKQYHLFPHYKPMLAQLAAAGFADVVDYERAKARYVQLFRDRALEIATLALEGSKKVVEGEIARTRDKRALQAMFADLATLRSYEDQTTGAGAGSRAPRPTEEDKATERRRLAAKYPSLADPEITVSELAARTPEALGGVLERNGKARLQNIGDTRERLQNKYEAIFELDRVVALTRQELGAEDGTAGWLTVKQHIDDIANRERWKSQTLLLLGIGLSVLTFGTGTPVVVGLSGGIALGAYAAHDEWEKYQTAFAAAHTSLDPAQSLSSRDPSLVWFAIALIGMGVDAAFLGKALMAAKPAIEVLKTTGDVTKFSSALAKVPELTPGLRLALTRSAAARDDFIAALKALMKASGRAFSGGDPTVLLKVAELAYHAARIGVRKFEVFLQSLKAERRILVGVNLDALTVDEVKAWKRAFRQGIEQFDKTRPTMQVPFKKGAKTLSFGDEMLLEGAPVGLRQRDDVMKTLGLRHTDEGHGVLRDARTLANEALQNAKPGGAGMSAQWASDEKMLAGLVEARARAAAGQAVQAPNGKWIVDFPATPDVGRVFVANSHLPGSATVRNAAPFAGLPVTEIAPTHVRAVLDRRAGTYTIDSIFPAALP